MLNGHLHGDNLHGDNLYGNNLHGERRLIFQSNVKESNISTLIFVGYIIMKRN